MASSIFTYAVSRPYPFRWFTPVAFIGGIIALALFSLLNFVSTGYTQSIEYVTDPNSTISSANWLNRWPSYFTSQIRPSCQAEELQINTQFFTNQTALTYTLTQIWTEKNSSRSFVPALTYLNNPIQDCQVNNIQIEIEAEDRTATQSGWTEWGETLQAFITCNIRSSDAIIHFNITSGYDFVPPTAAGFPTRNYTTQNGLFEFITRDQEAKSSLWWGESLLSQYWAYVSLKMQETRLKTDDNLRKGVIQFTQPDASNPIQDISDLNFFNIDYRFLTETVPEEIGDQTQFMPSINNYTASVSNLSSNNATPNVWLASDSLAKSFYSTIMTDLGQTTATPNILLNETALQYFTLNFTTMQTSFINAVPGPAHDSYDALKYQTGPLNNSAAVITTKYLCQVPKRKSTGTLFVSILVADLVFMQALWKIYCFLTVIWLEHKDSQANHCSGCEGKTGIPLASLAASDHELEHSRCESQTGIPLVSPAASDHELEHSRSFKPGIGRKGTRYSRLESPSGNARVENDI